MKFVRWLALFLFTVAMAARSTSLAQSSTTPAIVVTAIEGSSATVEYPSGGVSVLTVGAILSPDDLVIPNGGTVWVLCPDLNTNRIVDDFSPADCGADIIDPVIVVGGLEIVDPQLRSSNPLIMTIITPRNTRLLDTTPTIRWLPINGATSYSVTLQTLAGDVLWEESGIAESMLPYPNSAAPLRGLDDAGNRIEYLIFVRAFEDSANVSEIATVRDSNNRGTITVVSTQERVEIDSVLARLDSAEFPADTRAEALAYVRAKYLFNLGLYADTVDTLGGLYDLDGDMSDVSASRLSTSPHLYALLGDTFRLTQLSSYAATAYERTLSLAEALDDIAMQAYAHTMLAAYAADTETAVGHLQEALSLYEQIGNVENAALVREELARRGA